MKKYRKPHSVLVNLESEGILDFNVSGEGDASDALAKRQNRIIIDDEEEDY